MINLFKPTLGIQLFTLARHVQTAEDFDETLGKLEKMGVHDVQISGVGDCISALERKEILQKHNMHVCVTHDDLDDMRSNLTRLIDEHILIGCDAIGLGCMPEQYRTPYSATKGFIDELEGIAKSIKSAGMTFQYHNHDFEFGTLDGSDKCMMDIFLEHKAVNFVPDVAWMQIAGVNPIEMLHKMKGRVKVIHFKDYDLDENGAYHFVSLGTGKVDLKACYAAAVELEIPYIVYEQDSGWINDDAFLATRQSWDYLQGLENEMCKQ